MKFLLHYRKQKDTYIYPLKDNTETSYNNRGIKINLKSEHILVWIIYIYSYKQFEGIMGI